MWIESAFTIFVDLMIIFIFVGGPVIILGLISAGLYKLYEIYLERVERRRGYYVDTNRYER